MPWPIRSRRSRPAAVSCTSQALSKAANMRALSSDTIFSAPTASTMSAAPERT